MNMIAPPAYENIGEMVEEIRHLRERLKEVTDESVLLRGMVGPLVRWMKADVGTDEYVIAWIALRNAAETLVGSCGPKPETGGGK